MKLKDYLLEDVPLYEGIEINLKSRTVKLTDENEDFVDTSIDNNPTTSSTAISIFKRKKSESDGNPLVYALKVQKGWTISDEDKEELFRRANKILDKIQLDIDLVIIPPSSSELNQVLGEMVAEKFKAETLNYCLMKRTKEEVLDDVDWSLFSDKETEQLSDAFSRMGVYFEAKKFPKEDSLKERFEAGIFKFNPECKGKDVLKKNVLVVDDILSSGLTLSMCAKVIEEQFFPKSVHNLVMFSGVR